MLRRLALLTPVALLAATLAGSPSAQAQAQIDTACIFEGLAGSLSPAVPSALADLGNGNAFDIEQGNYMLLSSGGVCAGTFDGTPRVVPAPNLQSTGYYDNIVCGTGFWHDLDGSHTSLSGTDSTGQFFSLTGIGYEIAFVGGVGLLRLGPNGEPSFAALMGAAPHAGASGSDQGHGALSSAYTGRGLVQIAPGNASTQNCVNSGATQFQVKGFFVAESATGGTPPNEAPANTVRPVVTGVPASGQTLTSSTGEWSGAPTSFNYTWLRCEALDANVDGTTCTTAAGPSASNQYVISADDAGKTIRAEVTAFNSFGSKSARSLPTPAVASSRPPAGQPSALCETQGGTAVPDQHALGQVDFWTYVSQPAAGRVNVCVRARAGAQVVGGRLEIDTGGSLGTAPHADASSTDVSTTHCPQQIHESTGIDRIYSNAPGSNPIKLCVTLLGTSRRIELGTTSSPAVPFVRWVRDTDSAVPAAQFP